MIHSRKARLSAGIVLGVAALTTPLAALAGPASAAPSAAAASATYHGTSGSAKRLTQAATISSLPKVASAFRSEGPRVFSPVRPKSPSTVGAADAATEGASTMGGQNGVLASFNGLSDLQSDNLNGFAVTPPDQGLCVGSDATLGGTKAVFEPINLAVRETSVNGNLLRPDVSLATLFADPYAEGDVRCLYDQATQTFFFTEIGFPVATGPAADSNNTTADVLVVNAGARPPTSSTPHWAARAPGTASATSRRPGSTTTRSSSRPTNTAGRRNRTTRARSRWSSPNRSWSPRPRRSTTPS